MMRERCSDGSAVPHCGKALPFRPEASVITTRLCLGKQELRRSLSKTSKVATVRRSLTALWGGRAANPVRNRFRVRNKRRVTCFLVAIFLSLHLPAIPPANAQRSGAPRSDAHSAPRETFTPADRAMVERAIGVTCAERVRDPLGSMPIDEMQARPSLPVSNPEAQAGARRAERLLPMTKKLVALAVVQLAKEYGLYGPAGARAAVVPTKRRVSRNSPQRRTARPVAARPGIVDLRTRINAATARVEAVRRVRPDVDARDNASVLLRDPRVIDFGTIFLAGLRSDEGMVSVLAHELTHIASGQPNSLQPLFRAIARRAAARTGLRIQGQRAEELGCDLVGVMAARSFIRQTPSWEPLPRRLARAFEHNCVDDDASDEDHLSPRDTIRALLALDLSLASEELGEGGTGASLISPGLPYARPIMLTASARCS